MTAVFDSYATYYDLLYQDKNYIKETEYLVKLIRENMPQARDILELGSGTGVHAALLVQENFNVLGIDSSKSMVTQALSKKQQLDRRYSKKLFFEEGDVRNWRGNKLHDAVISLFHVFSYQLSNKDLENAFETVETHLKPGGLFIFDCWYGPAVLAEKPEVRIKRLENDEIQLTRIAEPHQNTEENRVDVHYEILLQNKISNAVETIKEVHPMRYLFLPEIKLLLEGAGLSFCAAYNWLEDTTINSGSWSAVIVARKI